MKEIMDTSLVEGYIFLFEVLDMVGKECQHVLLAVIGLLAQRLVGQCALRCGSVGGVRLLIWSNMHKS